MRKPRSEYPSEQSDKFLVRLPDGMRDSLKAAAESNNRSMNAEIVSRLEGSFLPPAVITVAPPSTDPPTESNTLYVLLDTDGMPISWNEATLHLSEINRAGKLKFDSQHARIFTSEHMASSERDEDWYALVLKYRELHGRNIPKSELAWLKEYRKRKETEGQADG